MTLTDAALARELEVLAARAERVRRKRVDDEDRAIAWLAEFPLRDESIAIPIERLRSAIPLRLVRPVPLAPPHVLGIVRHDGRLLCAYSLAALVGVRGWRRDPAVLLVIDGDEDHRFAIDCESIPRPMGLSARSLDEAREQAGDAAMVAVLREDSSVVTVVDVARLVERAMGDKAIEGRGP